MNDQFLTAIANRKTHANWLANWQKKDKTLWYNKPCLTHNKKNQSFIAKIASAFGGRYFHKKKSLTSGLQRNCLDSLTN